ncbi:MAG: heparan-alpha-glucosaminide N-acetyltransferase domain-containing protein [Bacilli bacterium]
MESNENVSIELSSPKKRIFEIDVLRSIAIIAMIIDHFTILLSFSSGFNGWASYLFSNYFDVNSPFMDSLINLVDKFQDSGFRLACHYVFVTLFLLLCGISCTFSHSNLKRSLKILGAGLIITLVTTIISIISQEEFYIFFGILSTIGCSIIIYEIIVRIYDNKWLLLLIGSLIILWGFLINWWDAPYINSIKDLNFIGIIEIILGYKIFGADCFGLLPCAGVVLIGGFIGKTLYKNRQSIMPKLDGKWTKPFTFISKHALLIYLLHQVLAVIIILLLYLLCGYRF